MNFAEEVYTLLPTRAAAEDVAIRNNENDPTWTYKVEALCGGFVIVVYDEDGERLGRI